MSIESTSFLRAIVNYLGPDLVAGGGGLYLGGVAYIVGSAARRMFSNSDPEPNTSIVNRNQRRKTRQISAKEVFFFQSNRHSLVFRSARRQLSSSFRDCISSETKLATATSLVHAPGNTPERKLHSNIEGDYWTWNQVMLARVTTRPLASVSSAATQVLPMAVPMIPLAPPSITQNVVPISRNHLSTITNTFLERSPFNVADSGNNALRAAGRALYDELIKGARKEETAVQKSSSSILDEASALMIELDRMITTEESGSEERKAIREELKNNERERKTARIVIIQTAEEAKAVRELWARLEVKMKDRHYHLRMNRILNGYVIPGATILGITAISLLAILKCIDTLGSILGPFSSKGKI